MAIPLRMERSAGEAERALDWWATLGAAEKARWLQCEESTDEIDTMLSSSVLQVRELAGFGAVGDAWNAYREYALTTLDFNDVIRAGGGEPLPRRPRERYERDAQHWAKAGRSPDLLETGTLLLVALRCWSHSEGAKREQAATPFDEPLLAYLEACLQARADKQPDWYEDALRERSHCDVCFERYRLENLTLCTNCLGVYCYRCVPHSPPADNGNVAHSCGGELVG